VLAVSPSATQAERWFGLTPIWCAPRPTQTRSAIRPVASSIADTVPAASLTSAHSPSGVTAAISGLWKLCRTGVGRSPGQDSSVTVPAVGLHTTTGPARPAASVVGWPATGTRRSTRPVASDTSSTVCSVSAVTTATGAPNLPRCTASAAEVAVSAGAVVVFASGVPGAGEALPEHPARAITSSKSVMSFMPDLRPRRRFASRGRERPLCAYYGDAHGCSV
jgi:hypothetical protein